MPSTYLIVIDVAGRALLLRKKVYGQFFNHKPIGKESPPFQVLNAAGQFVCSGGELAGGEKPSDGAIREFWEETGIQLAKIRAKVIEEKKFDGYYLTVCKADTVQILDDLVAQIVANRQAGNKIIADDEIEQVMVVKITALPEYLGKSRTLTDPEQKDVNFYVTGTGPYAGQKPKKYSQAIDWYGEIAKYMQKFA